MSTPVTKALEQPITKQTRRDILWRDFAFLILTGIALNIVSYVETRAGGNHDDDDDGGGGSSHPQSSFQIVDSGFVLTTPLYEILAANRNLNDLLAFLNSLILIIPTIYATYITLWIGDYTLSFRLIATYLLRSFCGWFTYLPPHPTFLMSVYDFPEIVQCFFSDCTTKQPEVLPFVSFFSGHVAATVIAANHMYQRKRTKSAFALHTFNVLQILRLLATRGHYSIDIIIGWCVAVYVSNPAERLGLSYSRGVVWHEFVPKTKIDAFETVVGVADCRRRITDPMTSEEDDDEFQTPTAAKIAAQMASEFAMRNLADLRREVELRGITIQEIQKLQRKDLIQLLSWAQLKIEELKAEARLLDVRLPVEMMNDKKKIIEMMWQRAKMMFDERSVNSWFRRSSSSSLNSEEQEKKGDEKLLFEEKKITEMMNAKENMELKKDQ